MDYEIQCYEVEYFRKNNCGRCTVSFSTEEEAIDFIKESRNGWYEYKLIKIQTAIIDF